MFNRDKCESENQIIFCSEIKNTEGSNFILNFHPRMARDRLMMHCVC